MDKEIRTFRRNEDIRAAVVAFTAILSFVAIMAVIHLPCDDLTLKVIGVILTSLLGVATFCLVAYITSQATKLEKQAYNVNLPRIHDTEDRL